VYLQAVHVPESHERSWSLPSTRFNLHSLLTTRPYVGFDRATAHTLALIRQISATDVDSSRDATFAGVYYREHGHLHRSSRVAVTRCLAGIVSISSFRRASLAISSKGPAGAGLPVDLLRRVFAYMP
jgi:hypothetical protein